MGSLFEKFVPTSVKARIKQSLTNQIEHDIDARIKQSLTNQIEHDIDVRIKEAVRVPASNDVLASLYWPQAYQVTETGKCTWNRQIHSSSSNPSTLPFPPSELRMGHSADDAGFSAAGEQSANWIRRIAQREGIALDRDASVMDWGCASGRVLRCFAKEAEHGEFWGVDQYGAAIAWSKENLSPPFKFLTCTAYPHLPFEDHKFNLIYGLSVFTHVLHLMDMWIMELRRILVPGGYALFTIHDEHTWKHLAENDEMRRQWIADKWWADESFDEGLKHDVEFFGDFNNWSSVVSFFKTDWLAREWGQYMEVVSIEPLCENYQSTVVLRKPG
jgi:SAM-dependent methyltransferase